MPREHDIYDWEGFGQIGSDGEGESIVKRSGRHGVVGTPFDSAKIEYRRSSQLERQIAW